MAHTQLQDGVAEENRTDNSLAQKRVVRIDLGNAVEKKGVKKNLRFVHEPAYAVRHAEVQTS